MTPADEFERAVDRLMVLLHPDTGALVSEVEAARSRVLSLHAAARGGVEPLVAALRDIQRVTLRPFPSSPPAEMVHWFDVNEAINAALPAFDEAKAITAAYDAMIAKYNQCGTMSEAVKSRWTIDVQEIIAAYKHGGTDEQRCDGCGERKPIHASSQKLCSPPITYRYCKECSTPPNEGKP